MEESQNERFERIKDCVLLNRPHMMGIGSLSEKSVHAVLKSYYAPTDDDLEVAVCGFVADVCFERQIFEIQTRHFYSMKRKLSAFLPEYDVTIVYPLPVKKVLFDIDPETGAVIKKRRSPKKRSEYEIFYEMYGIRDYLNDPHLHFKIVALEAEEYRYEGLKEKHGRKTKILTDLMPVRILKETDIEDIRDLMMFIPAELPEKFTTLDLSKAAGISRDLSSFCIGSLRIAGLIKVTGKGPRGVYLYSTTD